MQELGEKPKVLQQHQREPKCISGLWVTFEFSGDDGDLLVRRVFRRLRRPDESNCYSSFDSDAHMALLLAHLTALCNTYTWYSHACMNGYRELYETGVFYFPRRLSFQGSLPGGRSTLERWRGTGEIDRSRRLLVLIFLFLLLTLVSSDPGLLHNFMPPVSLFRAWL